MDYLSYLRELNMVSMLLRILCAALAGGLIGSERERKRRPAGFRTYILVSTGAAVTMILGQYMGLMLETRWAEAAAAVGARTDVSRFGAQVINGVGFLGAGTILVTGRHEIKGVTTAAGLWASACMGLAAGAGFFEGLLMSTAIVFFSMKYLPALEDAVMARSKTFEVCVEMDSIRNLGKLISTIKSRGVKFYNVDLSKEQNNCSTQILVVLSLRLPNRRQHSEILALLSAMDGVIGLQEI